MAGALLDYFNALDRLRGGKPERVAKGTKITNDAVAIEAGRGKGTIKKSRKVFAKLIEEIALASAEQSLKTPQSNKKLEASKSTAAFYRREYEAAIAREVSLLYELYELKKRLAALTGERIVPIRKDVSVD